MPKKANKIVNKIKTVVKGTINNMVTANKKRNEAFCKGVGKNYCKKK